jgi:hypothetical protein
MIPVFRLTLSFALVTSVFARGTLDALVNGAEVLRSPFSNKSPQSRATPPELAEKTISYAAAKTTYYQALRAAATPELMDIVTGKKPRPPEVDRFAQSYAGYEPKLSPLDVGERSSIRKQRAPALVR